MIRANGLLYSVEIHDTELRLFGKVISDKSKIDPIIPFSNIMGFDAGSAAGQNYVHIQTWNLNGYVNDDMTGLGILSSINNRNHIIFHLWFQRKAFKLLSGELKKIVDNNQAIISEKMKVDAEYRDLIREKIRTSGLSQYSESRTFYGVWIDI